MRSTITPAAMRELEHKAFTAGLAEGEELMRRAAEAVAMEAEKRLLSDHGTVLCFCGTGNNGGDAVAALRMLLEKKPELSGMIIPLSGNRSTDLLREMEKLRCLRERISEANDGDFTIDAPPVMILDGMFGTGLSRPLTGEAEEAVRRINLLHESGIPVVSVDIPSGLNGEEGRVMGAAVHADATVTFHKTKPGLYLKEGPDYCGDIITVSIGLEEAEKVVGTEESIRYGDRTDLRRWLPPRRKTLHKGNCGKVLLFVGQEGMAGAAGICATAALRTGAGLVTVACPEKIVPVIQTLCPCATCLPLPEDAPLAARVLRKKLTETDAFAAGCGIGTGRWAKTVLASVLQALCEITVRSVLDADALNMLGEIMPNGDWMIPPILTPHPGEAARLLEVSVAEIVNKPVESLNHIKEQYRVSCILKGARSLMSAKEGTALNPFGTPAMAKGGSGDALTGVLAALSAGRKTGLYAMNDLELLSCGCVLHSLAGMEAEKRFGERGVLATDLCACLGLDYGEDAMETLRLSSPVPSRDMIGRTVSVCVEKRAGSTAEGKQWPLNLGYVLEVLKEKDQWQNAFVFGHSEPLEWFTGRVCAVASGKDETCWIICGSDERPGREELLRDALKLGYDNVICE